MTTHSHQFVEKHTGFIGFGLNRTTDENTLIYYLQKFSDDNVMKHITRKLSDEELTTLFEQISLLLKKYMNEEEYHRLFLKRGCQGT